MLFQGLTREAYLLVIHLYDTDGQRLTVKLPPAEALDLVMELKKEEARLIELVRAENRRKEK